MKTGRPNLHYPILLFFFLLTLLPQWAGAQNVDSLAAIWTDADQPLEKRLSAGEALANALLYEEHARSREIAQELIRLSVDLDDRSYRFRAYTILGGTYYTQGEYADALRHYNTGYELADSMNDEGLLASAFNNLGTIYDATGRYTKALEYYQQSLSLKTKLNDRAGLANSYTNLGLVYQRQKEYDKALDYFLKSLEIDTEYDNKRGIANSYNNLGTTYGNLGQTRNAEEYYNKGLALFTSLDDQYGVANAYNNLGYLYEGKQPDRAQEYFKQALDIMKKIGDNYGMAVAHTNIGFLYIDKRNYTQSITSCEKAFDIADRYNMNLELHNACECLYISHKRKGNEGRALDYLERILKVKELLANDDTKSMLQEMEFNNLMEIQQIKFQNQHEADSLREAEKRLQMELSHRDEVERTTNIRNITIVTAIIILLIAGGLFTQLRIVRRSRKIIRQERDRSDELLLNILPEEIAKELKEKGSTTAKNHEKVTILFTDFKEFTQTSEKLSATELVEEINACFKAFDQIMGRYGVEKIKTIGDAYMAAGGLPVPESGSVIHTVKAALDMQRFISERKAQRDAVGDIAFEMRVGIHTGSAVAGIVGVKKFQYDIWGDTVNTASRMESSGMVGKVNISHDTYEIIKNEPEFAFQHRGKVEAKHKGAIDMYFVSYQENAAPSLDYLSVGRESVEFA